MYSLEINKFIAIQIIRIEVILFQVAQLTQFDDELYKVVGKRSEDEKDAEVRLFDL